MTNVELFKALGDISSENLFGAEQLQNNIRIDHKRPMKRAVLIAAVIALTALLVGCAAVFLLHLENLRIREEPYIENMRYEKDGSTIPSTEKIKQYISLVGSEGSKGQLAAREWLDYRQSYDPDGTLRSASKNFQKPTPYNNYTDAYTADMLNKIDEICEKYSLKLAGDAAIYQGNDPSVLAQMLDFDAVVKKGSGLEVEFQGARIVECGDFNAAYQATLKHSEATQEFTFSLIYEYHGKDYFSSRYLIIEDGEAVQQWNEKLSDGTDVLFVSDRGGDAYILCDREDAFINITIRNVGWDWASPGDVMTRADMKLIAQALDYSVKPTPVENMAGLQQQLEAARQALEALPEDPAAEAERKRIFEENEKHDNYADLIRQIRDHETYFTDHCNVAYENFWETMDYALLDITGDGQDELILGRNGHIHEIWTIQDGKTDTVTGSWYEGYLCEGNIYEAYVFVDGQPYHFYSQIESDGRTKPLMNVGYASSQGTWEIFGSGTEQQTISEDQAKQMIASYIRIPLEMKPVKEYPLN